MRNNESVKLGPRRRPYVWSPRVNGEVIADGESRQESQRGLVRQDSDHDAIDAQCTDFGSLAGA
jgi:hypothetical protein